MKMLGLFDFIFVQQFCCQSAKIKPLKVWQVESIFIDLEILFSVLQQISID